MICDYGCGGKATHTFKNGKNCCNKSTIHCAGVQNKKDPITGLTNEEKRLSLSKKSMKKVDPVTGLTPPQKIQKTLNEIDHHTGKTKRQLRDEKVQKKLNEEIDELTGLTKRQARNKKSSITQKAFSIEKKNDIINKRNISFNRIDPITGKTKRKLAAEKISITKTKINKITGLSIAQEVAIKNKNNPNWCSSIGRNKASKESMKFFNPLMEKIKDLNIKIFIGTEKNNEYFIQDSGNVPVRYYDFTIPELKIIIEYHGIYFHPNKEKLTTEEWNNWKTPVTNISADEIFKIDQHKKYLAMSKGFSIFYIWGDDNLIEKLFEMEKIIRSRIVE